LFASMSACGLHVTDGPSPLSLEHIQKK
jgi:hypothetical protein